MTLGGLDGESDGYGEAVRLCGTYGLQREGVFTQPHLVHSVQSNCKGKVSILKLRCATTKRIHKDVYYPFLISIFRAKAFISHWTDKLGLDIELVTQY